MVGWKFTKSFMSYLKPQFSFTLNFASLFNVMTKLLYFFSWNFIWFLQKDPIKVQNLRKLWVQLVSSKLTWESWQIWTQALKNLKKLHLNRLLLIKIYVWAKKEQRSYVWFHWKLMQNFKENWLVLSKVAWRIWQIFVQRLKNSNLKLKWGNKIRIRI